MKHVRTRKQKLNPSHNWSALPYVLFIFTGIGLLAYAFWTKPAPAPSLQPTPALDTTESEPEDMDPIKPLSVPAENTLPEMPAPSPEMPPLPPLNESDAALRKEALGITAHAEFYTWIAPDELIRRFVVVVDNLAVGNSPTRELEFMAPREKFSAVTNKTGQWFTSPKSFSRYNHMANLFNSLHVESCLVLLQRWYPLLQEAYVELGYPEREFREVLQMAVDELLATPTLKENPALVQRTGRYEYKDPLIEGLSPARRQLLRMGSENVEVIKTKLSEFKTGLANLDTVGAILDN